MPNACGKRLVKKSASMVQQRIALGFSSERGDHPWQVSENFWFFFRNDFKKKRIYISVLFEFVSVSFFFSWVKIVFFFLFCSGQYKIENVGWWDGTRLWSGGDLQTPRVDGGALCTWFGQRRLLCPGWWLQHRREYDILYILNND